MALVAVVACTGGIESSEKFAEGTASPCHGELIVFSLFLLACLLASLNRLFPVSDVSCYRSSQVARFWLLSTNSAKARMLPRSGFVQLANLRSARPIKCPECREPVRSARCFVSGHWVGRSDTQGLPLATAGICRQAKGGFATDAQFACWVPFARCLPQSFFRGAHSCLFLACRSQGCRGQVTHLKTRMRSSILFITPYQGSAPC